MKTKDFTFIILTTSSPHQVFQAVKNVRGWWSGYYGEHIEGDMEKLHDEFTFSAGDGAHNTRQKLVEVVPDRRLVWRIEESDLNFVTKRDEWTGTHVIFDITTAGDKTKLAFTHQGLSPEFECYDACSSAWSLYLKEKLTALINTGTAVTAL